MRTRFELQAILALIAVGISPPVFTDTEAAPEPYVTASEGAGSFYFKMVPEGDREAGGKGHLYMVGRNDDKLMYTTSGWYSPKVIVSPDGMDICRVGNSGRIGAWFAEERGLEPRPNEGPIARSPKEHIALAFYHKGELLKAYTVADLIPDQDRLFWTAGHYSFFVDVRFYQGRLSDEQKKAMNTQNSHGYWVIARTVDGQSLVFDMKTGARVTEGEVAEAALMSLYDAWQRVDAYLAEKKLDWKKYGNKLRLVDDYYDFLFTEGFATVHSVSIDRRTGAISASE